MCDMQCRVFLLYIFFQKRRFISLVLRFVSDVFDCAAGV